MSATETPIPSPLSNLPARKTLCARVVTPGWQPRVHGYDVQGDLARHYGYAELVLTTLVGAPPTPVQGARFGAAMCFAAPISIAQAPSHAATMARLCGTRSSGLLAVAAAALCDQARDIVERHAPLLAALEHEGPGWPGGDPPSIDGRELDDRGIDDDERAAVERLRALLREQGAYPSRLDGAHTLLSAILTTLHGAGLRHAWQFEAALCSARWPATIAEAMATEAGSLLDYPVHLPPVAYDPPTPTPAPGPAPPQATPGVTDGSDGDD